MRERFLKGVKDLLLAVALDGSRQLAIEDSRVAEDLSLGHIGQDLDVSSELVEDPGPFGLSEARLLKLLLLIFLFSGSGLGVATIDHPVGKLAIRDILQFAQCLLLGE